MKKKLEVHDFPPQYEDSKMKGWDEKALNIGIPEASPGVLSIAADEELYESRVYPGIISGQWEMKILAKRKIGADVVTILLKTREFATIPKLITVEEYHKHVVALEGISAHFLDFDNITICHAGDYERAMKGVKNDSVKKEV